MFHLRTAALLRTKDKYDGAALVSLVFPMGYFETEP